MQQNIKAYTNLPKFFLVKHDGYVRVGTHL
jgi:hypothetical protein